MPYIPEDKHVTRISAGVAEDIPDHGSFQQTDQTEHSFTIADDTVAVEVKALEEFEGVTYGGAVRVAFVSGGTDGSGGGSNKQKYWRLVAGESRVFQPGTTTRTIYYRADTSTNIAINVSELKG